MPSKAELYAGGNLEFQQGVGPVEQTERVREILTAVCDESNRLSFTGIRVVKGIFGDNSIAEMPQAVVAKPGLIMLERIYSNTFTLTGTEIEKYFSEWDD